MLSSYLYQLENCLLVLSIRTIYLSDCLKAALVRHFVSAKIDCPHRRLHIVHRIRPCGYIMRPLQCSYRDNRLPIGNHSEVQRVWTVYQNLSLREFSEDSVHCVAWSTRRCYSRLLIFIRLFVVLVNTFTVRNSIVFEWIAISSDSSNQWLATQSCNGNRKTHCELCSAKRHSAYAYHRKSFGWTV